MSAFNELLSERFAPHGHLSDPQLGLLERHYELLLRWNQKMNLTRLVSLDEVVELHYCESLYVARYLPEGCSRIADIGSGAGFPGIPMAIYCPHISVDLVESDQRKAVFLREAARELMNVRVIAKRADVVRNSYDCAVARAVAIEDVLGSGIADTYLVLGSEGEKLPWGENRRIRLVPRETSKP